MTKARNSRGRGRVTVSRAPWVAQRGTGPESVSRTSSRARGRRRWRRRSRPSRRPRGRSRRRPGATRLAGDGATVFQYRTIRSDVDAERLERREGLRALRGLVDELARSLEGHGLPGPRGGGRGDDGRGGAEGEDERQEEGTAHDLLPPTPGAVGSCGARVGCVAAWPVTSSPPTTSSRPTTRAPANERVPLLVLEPLRAFLDAARPRRGRRLEVEPDRRRALQRDLRHRARRRRGRAAPPAAPAAAAQRPRRAARGARAARARAHRGRASPRVLAVCDDEAVIGAPFYVMERVAGRRDHEQPAGRARHARGSGAGSARSSSTRSSRSTPSTGAALGLEGFGKPTGYLERQLRRFRACGSTTSTREIPAVERVGRWLAEHLPESPPATIVHGDFRLGNTMFAAQAPAAARRDLRLGDGDDRRPARRPRLPRACMWPEAGDPPRRHVRRSAT